MASYREIAPPARLAQLVECFWASEQGPCQTTVQRVVPDGCADLLYTRSAKAATLHFVGPMTQFADHEQPAASSLIGVRFRPALWSALWRMNAATMRDQLVPLDDLCAAEARPLRVRLDDASDTKSCLRVFEEWLPPMGLCTPAQRAVAALESSCGALSLDLAGNNAGLSARHFRRLCLEATGLSPKLLARILRFRRASILAPLMRQRQALLAAECGYADQSHLIADFRRFSGRTPTEIVRPAV
jgi:AraC-like DNA-binding protein